jgi:phosphohistidine swiveling domain-containing protein
MSDRITSNGKVSIVPLGHPGPLATCGGKAFHLGQLLQLGFPVPPGVVVLDSAFQDFLDANGLRAPITAACRNLNVEDPLALTCAAQSIRALLTQAPLPQELLDSLQAVVGEVLPGKTLIVRSSAVGEDSNRAAFAGMLDSILHVKTSAALADALRCCWASYWSERALCYRLSRGLELHGMGVVVQEQVAARLSGVLFTHSPDAAATGADVMVVEYCPGLGDALVSGRINPGRAVISRSRAKWRLDRRPESVGPGEPDSLDEATITLLKDAGQRLETALGGPQDIEWTLDAAGRFFLLQSRPITAFAGAAPRPDTTPGAVCVFSNANVNENYPGPISPLLYSVATLGYYHYFRNLGRAFGFSSRRIEAMEYPLRHVIAVHAGRMYYNLTNIHALLRMAPFGEFLAQSFNQFTGTAATEPGAVGPIPRGLGGSAILQGVEVCRIAVQALWHFLWLPPRLRAFEQTADAFAAANAPAALETRSRSELLAGLRGFLDIRCHRWLNASLADAASMIGYGLLKRFLGQEFPDEDGSTLHNNVLKGLRDLVSAEPVARLWHLSRSIRANAELHQVFAGSTSAEFLQVLRTDDHFGSFRADFEGFLEAWGFRRSGELMLTLPSFQEDPVGLVEVLRAYVMLEGKSPAELLARQQADRLQETERIAAILGKRRLLRFLPGPSKALLLRALLRWTHRAIALRERARLKQALLYQRCRGIALAIGAGLVGEGRLDEREDVFFLTVQELDALLAGGSMFPDQVRELTALRKQALEKMSCLTPPDHFELPLGTYWSGPARPEAARDSAPTADTGVTLRGLGVCGGKAKGPAAVLADLSEFARLARGDILVARQTDPGWGPVFFLIRGLVMERGGMLSHGAILAREYGIPTVVGVADAQRRIRHGQPILVNGDRGVIDLGS